MRTAVADPSQITFTLDDPVQPPPPKAPRTPEPETKIRIPRVYSYPGIASLTGERMPEIVVKFGDWEFLFNTAPSSRQMQNVVLRPMHLRLLFALCAFAREAHQDKVQEKRDNPLVQTSLEELMLPPVFEKRWLFGADDIFSFDTSLRALWRRMGNSGAPSRENKRMMLGCLEDLSISPIQLRLAAHLRKPGDDKWLLTKTIVHGFGESIEMSRLLRDGEITASPGMVISVSKNLLFLLERQYSPLLLDTFNSFTSDLARLLYLHYLPRAAGKPLWVKALPRIFSELGLPIPQYDSRLLYPLIRRNRLTPSVIEQLNGCPTLYGTLSASIRIPSRVKTEALRRKGKKAVPCLILRVLEASDSKLKATQLAKPGVLYSAWLKNGGQPARWDEMMKRRKTFRLEGFDADPYIANLWEQTHIKGWEEFRAPIEMGIAVIGMDRFRGIVGTIADHERTGKEPTKTRLHQLIFEIKEAVAQAAR